MYGSVEHWVDVVKTKMRRAISTNSFKSLPSHFPSCPLGFDALPLSFPLKFRKPYPQCSAVLSPFTVSIAPTPVVTLGFSIAGFRSHWSLDSNSGPQLVKCISTSVNSEPVLEWNEPLACSEVGEGHVHVPTKADAKHSIPVRAYFFCTSVNLKSLVQENKDNFIPATSRMTNYVVLKFGSLSSTKELGARLSRIDSSYMIVFQYGSIVLFNIPENVVDRYLKIVEKHASGVLHEAKKDEYEVIEKPALSTWMEAGLDYLMLQYMSVDAIRTIGTVLGQSIALDYYVRQVDDMVAKFTDINCSLEKTGTFEMDKKNLFQLLGKANSTLSDVILKLGFFERSDIAWKNAKYAQIWEYLRDEFELTQRFANLDFKLKFVEHNTSFLQEILQNRKSDFLEWTIIVLIAGEFLLSVYHTIMTLKGYK